MLDAKKMSEAIRMKRKKVKEDGVANMVDTAALPQMNPKDILNNKQQAQIDETMDLPKKITGPSDPADEDIKGTSQDKAELARQMKRVGRILGTLKM